MSPNIIAGHVKHYKNRLLLLEKNLQLQTTVEENYNA